MSDATQAATTGSGRPGVFLIHGLGGTQYDLGSMHKRLKNAGFVTHSLTLPGHGTTPEDLVAVTAEDWLEAVRRVYRELLPQYETLHVMGMCLGSLLATELTKQEQHSKGRLIVLAPPIHIDGWATPWYRSFRRALYYIPAIRNGMHVEEEEPYGIKNEQLRAIVKAKFERGEAFHYRWVPLACIAQVDRLRRMVMSRLDRMKCQTLIVHSREDELTSLRSADFLVRGIGGDRARVLVLENSYHMVCIDNDRELVGRHVLDFFGVPAVEAGQLGDHPKMTPAQMLDLLARVQALLEGGDWRDLPTLAIPELSWYQPGSNRLSGIHRGPKAMREFFNEVSAASEASRLTAFGTPVFNRGVALTPACWLARHGDRELRSQGALMVAMHADKVYELRWFPDDNDLEDAFWGEAPPKAQGGADALASLEERFEAAAARSRTLRRAPPEAALLELYGLYKQSNEGDVRGNRPGAFDPVGRAKYDAWARLKGTDRTEAMRKYVDVVDALIQADAAAA